PGRDAVGIGYVTADARDVNELHTEVDVVPGLAESERNRLRFGDPRHARIVCRRIGLLILIVGSEERRDVAAGDRTDHAGDGRCPPAAPASAAPTAAPAATAASCRAAEWQIDTRLRIDVVVAGHQPPHAVLTLIVGLGGAGRCETLIALLILIPK